MKYSIRMRASKEKLHEEGGTHISGAERITDEENLSCLAYEMVERALKHSKGKADFIRVSIDILQNEEIKIIPALNIKTYNACSVDDGLNKAKSLLSNNKISKLAVDKAIYFLQNLESNMRGAALFDAATGERLDSKENRGIRVSHMDYVNENELENFMKKVNLTNIHVREALALASKVKSCPYIVGEICWSDDPDYITGYVSYDNIYHRISMMKNMHSSKGGRVFFVELPLYKSNNDKMRYIDEIVDYLENKNILIDIRKSSLG